ncbi:hypothetical protein DPSP01_011579 [Paraphaeosphaeria sporulosa]
MTEQDTTIPKGSLILITGVNGFVASHLAKQFLERGYRVRGTVRSLDASSWLTSLLNTDAFELAHVPYFSVPTAFDDAVKGVSAIAHVAAVTSADPDPNNVIPVSISCVVNLLEAAMKEPSVREFVITSSLVSATLPVPGNTTRVERDTWNEMVLEMAWAPPPYEAERGGIVYAASKVATEKAFWDFVEKRKPHFTANAILPPMILGEPLHKSHAEVKAAYIRQLMTGDTAFLETMPATVAVDVKDLALLHIAAILDPSIRNVRFNTWAHFCNYNDMLPIMRAQLPERRFIDDMPGLTKLSLTTDTEQQVELLKKWGTNGGWVNLKQTVEENLMPLVEWGY